jgi:acetyltransferase-like isoleucine patch superfamily enzyme
MHIGRYARIGHSSFIMDGVIIRKGAIVGVDSVVINDIPAYVVALANPARDAVRNAYKTAGLLPL